MAKLNLKGWQKVLISVLLLLLGYSLVQIIIKGALSILALYGIESDFAAYIWIFIASLTGLLILGVSIKKIRKVLKKILRL